MYVSDHLFNPRQLESRYTYSDARGRRAGLGRRDARGPTRCRVIAALAGATENLLFTTGVYIAPAARPDDGGQVGRHDRRAVGQPPAARRRRRLVQGGVRPDRAGLRHPGQAPGRDDRRPARRCGAAAGWSSTATTTTCPECQMEPAPTEPVPIIGGGHSPVALRRTAALCDGWIAAGAYSEEEAWMHLAELHDALEKAGRRRRGLHDLPLAQRAARRRPVPPLRRRRRHRLRRARPGCSSTSHRAPPTTRRWRPALGAVRWFAEEIVAKV